MATMVVAILTAKRPEIDGLRSLLAFDESIYLAGFLWLLVAGAGKASLDWLFFARKAELPRPLLRPRTAEQR
jgi:uncharacterized membrane protein YphA (DoxX/SURF4 family)